MKWQLDASNETDTDQFQIPEMGGTYLPVRVQDSWVTCYRQSLFKPSSIACN